MPRVYDELPVPFSHAPLPQVPAVTPSSKHGFPLCHVSEQYQTLLWQCARVHTLAHDLAYVDIDTGAVVPDDTSATLAAIGERLGEALLVLRAAWPPAVLAQIAAETCAFEAFQVRVQRRWPRKPRPKPRAGGLAGPGGR